MKKYILVTLCCVCFSSSAKAGVKGLTELESIKQSIIVIFDVNKPKPIKY